MQLQEPPVLLPYKSSRVSGGQSIYMVCNGSQYTDTCTSLRFTNDKSFMSFTKKNTMNTIWFKLSQQDLIIQLELEAFINSTKWLGQQLCRGRICHYQYQEQTIDQNDQPPIFIFGCVALSDVFFANSTHGKEALS